MGALLPAAAFELHSRSLAVACVLLTVAALFWWGAHALGFLSGRSLAARELLRAVSRPLLRHFVALNIAMGAALHAEALVAAAAEIRLHPAVVGTVFLAVAALFNSAILTVNSLVARRPPEGESKTVPTVTAAAAPTCSASRIQFPCFVVLCFAIGAALHAKALLAAATEIRLHPAVVCIVFLAVVALFNSAILTVNSLVARLPPKGEPKTARCSTASAAAAPTCSASTPQLPYFFVLCFAMGAALHAEALVAAAADLVIVVAFILTVTALFNWAILSINFCVARRAAERELKMLPRPAVLAAPVTRSPHLARLVFLVLVALFSASCFIEPFALAAEHQLHRDVVIVLALLLAAMLNVTVHLFRSFFLPEPPSALTTAAQGNGVGAITGGIMGIGIATAACLVGIGGSAYPVFAPARS